jgi:hypothetical protein
MANQHTLSQTALSGGPAYRATDSTIAAIPEMLFSNSLGKLWRSIRYCGELYDIQTSPLSSSETRTLRGRSIASVGAAIISGVPALGLPNMSRRLGLIVRPALAASPLKSMRAKIASPCDITDDSRRSKVSSNECSLMTRTMPFLLAVNH